LNCYFVLSLAIYLGKINEVILIASKVLQTPATQMTEIHISKIPESLAFEFLQELSQTQKQTLEKLLPLRSC